MTLKPASPLKMARIQAGVTQVAMAQVLGLTKQRVSQLEASTNQDDQDRYLAALETVKAGGVRLLSYRRVGGHGKGPEDVPGAPPSTTTNRGTNPGRRGQA